MQGNASVATLSLYFINQNTTKKCEFILSKSYVLITA